MTASAWARRIGELALASGAGPREVERVALAVAAAWPWTVEDALDEIGHRVASGEGLAAIEVALTAPRPRCDGCGGRPDVAWEMVGERMLCEACAEREARSAPGGEGRAADGVRSVERGEKS